MHLDINAVSEDVNDTRPMCCAHVGLDCGTCVRQSARKVAALCTHLSTDQQTAVFFQVYRDRVCRTNVKRFRREYDQLTASADPAAPSGLELALA